MTLYNNFVGIDIGKFTFVVNTYGSKHAVEFDNTPEGAHKFIHSYSAVLPDSLCVLETTGGYEMQLLQTLYKKGHAIHRANARKVKNFIRSYGNAAKSDALDSKALALYGYERHTRLERFVSLSEDERTLQELFKRRSELKQMMVAEKNRLQAPTINKVKGSVQSMIEVLTVEVKQIDDSIKSIMDNNKVLREKKEILKKIPGIGEVISSGLLIMLPELGKFDRRKIASLAGVAPCNNDSGQHRGYRRTSRGRDGIKPQLFIAAMAARNSHSSLKTFYTGLVDRGKPKKVALTALMRKILVIAHARIKEYESNL